MPPSITYSAPVMKAALGDASKASAVLLNMAAVSALGLRRDPHGSMKQIHHEELEDGDQERPSAFPKIMLK